MFELILKSLQTKYAGVDEKTLTRIAKKLEKTVTKEEDVQTAVDGVSIQDLMDSFADERATSASKTAVANYEKKHNLKDGKPVEPEPAPNKKDGEGDDLKDAPAWAKAIIESNKSMADKLAAYEAKELGTSRKGKLSELLKEAPDSVRKMYEAYFAQMSFADDAAFDGWLEAQMPVVEGLVNDYKAKGGVVHRPMGGGSGKQPGQVDPRLKAYYDAQAANQSAAAVASARVMGMPAMQAAPAPQATE